MRLEMVNSPLQRLREHLRSELNKRLKRHSRPKVSDGFHLHGSGFPTRFRRFGDELLEHDRAIGCMSPDTTRKVSNLSTMHQFSDTMAQDWRNSRLVVSLRCPSEGVTGFVLHRCLVEPCLEDLDE